MLKLPKLPRKQQIKSGAETNEKSGESLLAISLGLYHIGCVMGTVEDGKIQIIGHGQTTVDSEEAILNLDKNEIIEKISEVIEKAKATSQFSTNKVIFGVPSKFLYSKTSTVRIKRKDPDKKITKDEIDEISKKIIQKAMQEVEEKSNNVGGLELLNSDTTFAKIDGYITKDLEGFRGSTVEISTFMSFIEKRILDKVLQLAKVLKLNIITIVPSIYTTNKLLNLKDLNNYLLVNVAGKATTTAVVFAGEINIISYFSLGYKSFLNYISKVAGVTESEVVDAIKENVINEKINQSKNKIVDLWAESFKNSLGFIESIKVYPEQIIIYGLGASLIENSEISGKLSQLKFKDIPTVKSLKMSDLNNITDHTQTIKSTELIDSIGLLNFGFKIVQNG